MIQSIDAKKILLFAPRFFNYEIAIINQIESNGGIVDFYDERPSNNLMTKILIRIGYKKIINYKINNYYGSILNSLSNDYDYVLIINPESLSKHILEKFRAKLTRAKFIIYMWDSVKNKKSQLQFVGVVDKFITFDPEDIKFDSRITHVPLFYIPQYSMLNNNLSNCAYDISFIGSLHCDRYRIVKEIERQLPVGMRVFFYFYYPSKIIFFIRKLFDKDFQIIRVSDVKFHPLSSNQVIKIIDKSRVVIDVEHKFQSGLTMRTIEIFGAMRKLITSNYNIKKYNLYSIKNHYIFDRNNIDLQNIKQFIDGEFELECKEVYNSYSLNSWLLKVFQL